MIAGLAAFLLAAAPPVAWTPDSIPWEAAGPDGTRFALLEGVRDRPGVAFTYAFFIPAGVWDAPHRHAATARVFVARGALRLAMGSSSDRSQAAAYPAGSTIIVPAGAWHFDGASDDTIIIGSAVGPWATEYAGADSAPSAGTPK